MEIPIGQEPKTSSGRTIRKYETGEEHHHIRNILIVIIFAAGILSVAFLVTGGLENIQSLASDFGIGGPEPPEIALNPPGDDSRETMRDKLIESGVNENDIVSIRKIGDKQSPNGNEEFIFNESNLPKKVPLSKYVVINNVEILEGDKVRYEVENTASVEKDMPFVELQIFVNIIRPSGEPHRTQIYRATSIEFGEEKMAPGEKRMFVTEEPWEILKSAGYEKEGYSYNGIDSIWFEINDFESFKTMV